MIDYKDCGVDKHEKLSGWDIAGVIGLLIFFTSLAFLPAIRDLVKDFI